MQVLIVATSASKMGDHATGAWSEEICGPFFTFVDGGFEVTVCSIAGGDVPIDAGSLSDSFKTENDERMIQSGCGPLKGTKALADFDVCTFDIIFFAGGHGTCVDFPTDEVGEVVSKAFKAGKVVAAVCHGPSCLVNAKIDGEPLVKGKRIAAFTDVEEDQVGLTTKVPFLLEAKLKELGATVETAEPWSDKTVADGKLVTGQNPQSSVSVAKLAMATVALPVDASKASEADASCDIPEAGAGFDAPEVDDLIEADAGVDETKLAMATVAFPVDTSKAHSISEADASCDIPEAGAGFDAPEVGNLTEADAGFDDIPKAAATSKADSISEVDAVCDIPKAGADFDAGTSKAHSISEVDAACDIPTAVAGFDAPKADAAEVELPNVDTVEANPVHSPVKPETPLDQAQVQGSRNVSQRLHRTLTAAWRQRNIQQQ